MMFKDKAVLVTGATSGIGRATALKFAAEGARVALVGRSPDALDATRKALAGNGDGAAIQADVTREEDVRRAMDEAVRASRGLDVLVCGAGVIGTGNIETTTPELWDQMMAVNVRSVFRLVQLALPALASRKGNIVVVSSVNGQLTGRIELEYRDVNRPTDIAVDASGLLLIEANQTQLSRFSLEGQLVWRIPRFQGLAWVIPDGASAGGWVGAQRFEGREGGVFRLEPDGKVTRVSGPVAPRVTSEWNRGRLAPEAIRAARPGRVYIREGQAIAILGVDGTLLKRIEGFRYKTEQRVRR